MWHGSSDTTVVPANAEANLKQWMDVHETTMLPEHYVGEGYVKAIWRTEDGRAVVESVTIPGLAHGVPLAVTAEDEHCGETGPFLLEAGVSSTHHIARFFGLIEPSKPPLLHDAAKSGTPLSSLV